MPSLLHSVRVRTLIVLLAAVVTVLAGLGWWAHHLLRDSFERLEAVEAVEQLNLVRKAFADRCDLLATTAVAWNQWSNGGDPMEARDAPLPGDASLLLTVHLGAVPELGRVGLGAKVPVAVVPSVVAQVASTASASSALSGHLLLVHDERPLLVVWQRQLLVDGDVGAVVAGRWLDQGWVTRFGESIQHQVRLQARRAVTLTQREAVELDGAEGLVLRRSDEEELTGLARIDLAGSPLVALVSLDRGTVAAGGLTWDILMIAISATGVVLVVATLLLLERTVLARLTRLGQRLAEIAQTNDPAGLVDQTGHDEIATLGGEVNRLLASQRGWREQISRRNAAMRLIFDTLPIGLLSLDTSGRIQPERSSATIDLLGRADLDGADLGELLAPGPNGAITRRRLTDYLQIVCSGTVDADELDEVNPVKIVTIPRSNGPLVLRLRFYSLDHGSGTTRRFRRETAQPSRSSGVLVMLSDISDERRLAAEVERSHLDYEQLKAMAEDVDLFNGFIGRLRSMVRQLSDLSARMGTAPDRVQLSDLQRDVRALRSGGEIFSLANLEQAARSFDVELVRFLGMTNLSDAEVRRCRYGVADLEAVVVTIERQFRSLLGDEEGAAPAQVGQRTTMPRTREELRVAKRSCLVQLSGLLMQPARSGLAATLRMVQPMARRRGVDVRFTVQGDEVLIDLAHQEALNLVLPHLLRHACDHGFDDPATRVAAGKPSSPALTLAIERTERSLVVTLADDGAGIDPVRMRVLAIEQGLLTADVAAALDDQAAQALMFRLANESKDQSLSGAHPVSLDLIVKRLEEEVRAEVSVQSVTGQGTTVRIVIPLVTL